MQNVAMFPAQATEKQVNFMYKLAGERVVEQWGTNGEERIETLGAKVQDLGTQFDRKMASAMIDFLLGRPVDEREAEFEARYGAKTPTTTVPVKDEAPLTPGVFEVNGQVFVVKPNKAGTNLYAKRLIEINADRLTESGDVVQIEFVYAPGAIRTIKSHHRMPIERAEALAIRYGRCINCNRPLKAAKSVRAGIGPVCVKLFAA